MPRHTFGRAMRWLCACLLLGVAVAPFAHTNAAAFPSRAIRMIVPVAAGGPTDLLARNMAPKLSETPWRT